MRVVLAPFGSRGDVQPFLALGCGLRARGHEVVVAAATSFRSWVEEMGFIFRPVGGDVQSWVREQGAPARHPIRFLRAFSRYLREEVPACFEQTQQAIRDADLVVSTLHIAARSVAEALGIPYRTVVFTTQLIPSRHHPPLAFPSQALPGWLNRVLWWFSAKIFDLVLKKPVNRQRAGLGLSAIPGFLGYARTEHPIVASDPAFAPLPSDAPPGIVQTGAFVLPVAGRLGPEVETFLRAGEPPVYVGFGSTPDDAPERTSRIIAEAVRAVGRRAILSVGWSGLGGLPLPKDVLCVAEVPHALLFPRVLTVVHHGGAGTTATALRAGVPQIIVPQTGDQYFHGNRIHDLGLGPALVRRLTAKRLAQALRAVLNDPTFAQRARVIADSVRLLDGVGAAIEELLTQHRMQH